MTSEKCPIPKRRFTWHWKAAIAASLVMSAAGLYFAMRPEPSTPEADRYGWAGPEVVAQAAPIVESMPPFQIEGVKQDNRTANVRLWEFSKAVNGGNHLPNIPQQVGDCVSWGAKNAVDYLQCVQITRGPPTHDFHPAFAPYIYGISRVQVGNGRLSGDGSIGAWAAEGVRKFGILRNDYGNVPPYSGSVARKWGRRPGPPDEFIDEARKFPVETVAPVRSADEVRDAICNGYPCTIASNWGGRQDAGLSRKYNRVVFRRSGSWSHQMSVIAYDGSQGEPLFYVLNSWGPRAHPKPTDDAPPGGFWITETDMDRIASAGDSFAFSGFKGFPARELDFHIVGDRDNEN